MGPRKGVWEPLPLIVFGYAIHPLVTTAENRKSRPNGDIDPNSLVNSKDIVPLEVGDNVYAFEQYHPIRDETSGVWYRGYVVFTTPRGHAQLTDGENAKIDEPQQDVFIGIFPASHIHVRDELPDPEGHLASVLNSPEQHQINGANLSEANSFLKQDPYAASSPFSSRPTTIMDTIAESIRDDSESIHHDRSSFKLGPPPDQMHSSRAGLPVRTPSVRSVSPPPSENFITKPFPPRASLKSGDDTLSGVSQPIVDEIASALREWHNLMFNYLAQRNYTLFHTVREHIDALHLGRRQLLAQTLSTEEIINLRRDCVYRLVSGNVAQGLDVIVRHPDWGGLASVDVEGEIDQRSWMGAIRMYVMQATLAYIETAPTIPKSPLTSLHSHKTLASSISSYNEATSASGPMPTPASSAFPEGAVPQRPTTGSSFRSSVPAPSAHSPSLKFYHIYLEIRAFVAPLCAKGEFAELYFSLFNKSENRFLTEEFCAILNHNAVLARDPTATRPVSTLFTELAPQEVQDSIYLVCRIVRKGAMRMSSDHGGVFSPRRPSHPRFRGGAVDTGFSVETSITTNGAVTLPSTVDMEDTHQLQTIPVLPANAPGFRRPFGCAVLELSQLSKMTADTSNVSSTKDYSMPIFVPINEAAFSTLHQDLVENRTKEFEKSTRAENIAVSIKVFHGDAKVVIRENPSLLKETPVTARLGFPDVVFPGDVRNEVYVKLWSGEFSSFTTGGSVRRSLVSLTSPASGPPNVQVTVEARTRNGSVIEGAISSGSGEPPVTQYHSLVFYRNHMPTFGELLKLSLPVKELPQCHLFFTFRIRSSRDRGPSSKAENERPFAFAYFPLFTNNNAVQDGSHTLVLYRVDRAGPMTPSEYLDAPPTLTGANPLTLNIPSSVAKTAVPMKDSLVIRSLLCSTTYTHSKFLLGLLHWEEITDTAELATCLSKFTFIGEHEIVKFLSDIFDSLFKILSSQRNQGGEIDDLVFNALVKVLGIIQDRRFTNFQPVLDVYIDKHFSCATASSHIIRSMNRLLANPNGPETATLLRAALKVWPYIFKFIAKSRELQKVKEIAVGGGATATHLDSNFKRELKSHLEEVNRMMCSTSSAIVGTQTIAVKKFTSILPHLDKIFNTSELVSITISFANAIPVDGKGKLASWKLIMYLEVVKGFLFDRPSARVTLVEAITNHVRPHFGRFDEYAQQPAPVTDQAKNASRISWLENTRLCISIMAVMLDRLQKALVEPDTLMDQRRLRDEQGNVDYLLFLFPKLIESYREFKSPTNFKLLEHSGSPAAVVANVPVIFPQSYPFSLVAKLPPSGANNQSSSSETQSRGFLNPGLGEIAIVFLALMHSSSRKDLLDFFENTLAADGADNFAQMMSRVFELATSILVNDAFPAKWLNVNIFAHKVILRMMDPISLILRREFIPQQQVAYQFNATLWRESFFMLLTLLSSDQLVIEEFSPQRRRAVWRLGGDIRGEGATILLQLWNALGWPEDIDSQSGVSGRYGGYQVALNSLVGNVVNLCLSLHEQLRTNAVQILYGMIVSEYYLSDNFDEIENELVNKLDSLFMSDSKGDDITRAYFIDQLRALFESSNVDEELRSRVLAFLNSVDQFLQLLLDVRALPEGEEYQDDRVIATLRLMNYIRRIGRDEIYIKYVHQLVNMHLQSLNYVEAALTLKLHSDLYDWDLNSFLEGMPDLGLPRQSQFHRKETLCLLILDYLGKGKAWESAIDICKELAAQHSEVTFDYHRLSEILLHQATLLEHIITDQRYYSDYFRVAFYGAFPNALRNKQFIYRGYEWEKFGAFCERMLNKHPGAQLLKTADPPEDILSSDGQWIQCTAVVPEPNRILPIFTNPQVPLAIKTHYEHSAINRFSCARQVIKQNSQGGEEIWEEKTFFTTEETFPTVLRRSEVINVHIIEISPLENAITEIEQKTKELLTLEFKYSTLSQAGQSVSTNTLTMALNGAVDNLSTAQYKETFLDSDYIRMYPDRATLFQKLHRTLVEQVRVIDSCLKLHSVLCPQDMLPFHEAMERMFRKNFQDEIQRLNDDEILDDAEPGTMIDGHSVRKSVSSHYQQSLHDAAGSRRKGSQVPTKPQRSPFVIPPLQLGRTELDPSPVSPVPRSSRPNSITSIPKVSGSKQTPLQKHLAQLARYGMNAVSSGPGDRSINGNSDTQSDPGSPRNSIENASEPALGAAAISGVSLAASHQGSVNSHQLRGRFSRFGSGFNFGQRRDGTLNN